MLHVIVGAGPVGTATASLLADRGERVRVITRRGTGPERPEVERVAADATDSARLIELAKGAAALYNCASPPYHQWLTDWPPLNQALLRAAESSGAVLASACNVAGRDPAQAEAAGRHVARHARRASGREDPRHRGARQRLHRGQLDLQLRAGQAAAGRPTRLGAREAQRPAQLDVGPRRGGGPGHHRHYRAGMGRGWLVPTNPPLTVRELATRFTELNGAPTPRLTSMPYAALWTAGLFSPTIKELRHTYYQWNRPFTIDSSATEREFGLTPVPIDSALANVLC
jgi:hypothetical protein